MRKLSTLLMPLLFFYCPLFSQDTIPPKNWEDIESDIAAKRNLITNQELLTAWKEKGIQENDEASFVRAFYDLMLIADRKTEDTLYWKNSFFIDSIISDNYSSAQLKSVAHLLKARRILGYRSKFYNRNNKNLIANYHPVYKYNLMMDSSLDSLTIFHFEKAITFSSQVKNKNTSRYLWLSFDPLQFLFRPDFTDIIFSEETHFLELITSRKNIKEIPDWIKSEPAEFFRPSAQWKDFSFQEQKIYSAYQRWANYHSAEPHAWYFIETMARKSLYNGLNTHTGLEKVYSAYLQKLVQSPYTAARANGIYQLCLLWNRQAKFYNPHTNQYNNYNYSSVRTGFDTVFRNHYVKALQLFESNEKTLDSFPFMKDILVRMRNNIQKSTLNIATKTYLPPGEPLLFFLHFRNTRQIHYRIVRIKYIFNGPEITSRNISQYISLPALKDSIIEVPATNDYQLHNSYLKLNSLSPGRYILLYSDAPITNLNGNIKQITLNITDIAAINNGQKVFVLSRKTGFPVEGASAILYRNRKNKTNEYEKDGQGPKTISADGSLTTSESASHILVSTATDTFFTNLDMLHERLPDELFDEDEYDDLYEYYEDNIRVNIFTDRAIYRPGQTVFYKGIFLTNNPRTGEQVILNWKNLQFSFFKKLFYRALVKLSKQKIELSIDDPFGREMDSLKILPDKYGSFSGSFKIPKDAATGEWEIGSWQFDNADENSGTFMVEEYKRPAFALSLEKPMIEKKAGDSFSVKVKVRSFSGAALNNIRLKYEVNVDGQIPIIENRNSDYLNYNKTLIESESVTDEKGEFMIRVKDSLPEGYNQAPNQDFRLHYTITATAIDGTGESHEEELEVILSSRPVHIRAFIPTIAERTSLGPVNITTTADPGGIVKKQVKIKLYRDLDKHRKSYGDQWPATDLWIIPKSEMISVFPDEGFDSDEINDDQNTLVYETSLTTGGTELLTIPVEILTTGNYEIEITAIENGNITGEFNKTFSVYDQQTGTIPEMSKDFQFLASNYAQAGTELNWITGTKNSRIFCVYHLAWYAKSKSGIKLVNEYITRFEGNGINEWKFTIPSNAVSTVKLNRLYICKGQLNSSEQQVYMQDASKSEPEIVVEHFRQKMVPGSNEKFIVSIRTNDINTAAELMTTMYDASLDKLAEHKWTKPVTRTHFYVNDNWESTINSNTGYYSVYDPADFNITAPANKLKIWWMDSAISNGFLNGADDDYQLATLQGKVAGIQILQTTGLNEVVVTGYGTQRLRSLTSASFIQIRGVASLAGYSSMLIVVDGKIYSGDIKNINQNLITDAAVLKGASATSIYGSRGSNGVLVLSTQGPIGDLEAPPEPPLVIRKNFSETAFFFPKIYADKKGFYNIQFTLPESVTEWKWKMMAHTKDARFVYAEKTLVSQNQLMVQPDMPRFLHQGDQLVLKSRISNLDTAMAEGKLICTVEDLVTGEDITNTIISGNEQTVSVSPSSNAYGSFVLKIPENILHPLRVKVSVRSKSFADGEEYTLPILSRRVMISTQVALKMGIEKSKKMNAPSIPADAVPYGISLNIIPKRQATLINALPWLANYPYTCAEQTFNKLFAHAVAIGIARKEPMLKSRYDAADTATGSSLPYELSEQTMPWLQLANKSSIQKEQLTKLFDTLKGYQKIEKYFSDISDQQKSDGGVSWFKGGNSDRYISNYLLSGFGKLRQEHPYVFTKLNSKGELIRFIEKLVNYSDNNPYHEGFEQNVLYYLDARMSWVKDFPIADSIRNRIDKDLLALWSKKENYTLPEHATMITSTLKFYPQEHELYKKAIDLLESIRQLAITDTIHGTRWKEIADTDNLSSVNEDWLMQLAEAFETAGHSEETIRGIIQWLLAAKNENHWSSTRSTAEIISLIGRHQATVIDETKDLNIRIANKIMQVSNDLFNGASTVFSETSVEQFKSEIIAEKKSTSPVSGSLVYYYFTSNPETDTENHGIKIIKTIMKMNPVSKKWEELTEGEKIRVADKLKVILGIESPKQLSYVFIDDKRAACLEPLEALSGYEYEDKLGYYKSIRDQGFQFFLEKIPSGSSHISYELVVAKEGIFSNGITSLQCMYQPERVAWSKGMKLESVQ